MDKTMTVNKIEERFLEVTKFDCNLNKFPLEITDCSKIKKDKEKSNLHGEVFTPLWFVDKMILKAGDSLKKAKTTHDLCAGYGQFTVRILRFLVEKQESFNPENWLKGVHSFSEYQPSSACKLLYIFGTDINLFIGDAEKLGELKDTDNGILLTCNVSIYNAKKNKWGKKNKWVNVTDNIKSIFKVEKKYSKKLEDKFIEKLDKMRKKEER